MTTSPEVPLRDGRSPDQRSPWEAPRHEGASITPEQLEAARRAEEKRPHPTEGDSVLDGLPRKVSREELERQWIEDNGGPPARHEYRD